MPAPTFALDAAGTALTVATATRGPRRISAATLWRECPSALRRSQRLQGAVPSDPVDLRIVRVDPVGNYAVNIAFSDGHDRGVYPWALLMHLARMPNLSDFLIPAADAAPHSRKEPQ